VGDEATVDGPARRRASWSLKTIVEDVAGRPISELQDPARPMHPYLRGKIEEPVMRGASGGATEPPYDPVTHLYPPLVGPTGREYHGAENEHDRDTLERHRPVGEGGRAPRAPGPTHRPERLYLHYLLLHMDRLSDSALRYLRIAVEEETAHRARPSPSAESHVPPAESPEPAPLA
jgi:hypothetical protein